MAKTHTSASAQRPLKRTLAPAAALFMFLLLAVPSTALAVDVTGYVREVRVTDQYIRVRLEDNAGTPLEHACGAPGTSYVIVYSTPETREAYRAVLIAALLANRQVIIRSTNESNECRIQRVTLRRDL